MGAAGRSWNHVGRTGRERPWGWDLSMARFELRYDLRNPVEAGTTVAERYDAALEQIAWGEQHGSGDFSPLWSGQNASGCQAVPAAELTRSLAQGFAGRLG